MSNSAAGGSLRWNIAVSAVSMVYIALIGLVMAPVYIHWMGVEVYGLIGFHAMLQGWFALLDLGLSHSFSRQVARFQGGVGSALHLRQLLRALELIFIAVASIGALGIILGSDRIATRWIQAQHIGQGEVARSIMLMALIIGVRWVSGLYRALIVGSEQLVWLGWVSMALATLRAVGVLGLFALWDSSPTTFFAWQLAGTVLEVAVFATMAYRLLPTVEGHLPYSWRPLREVLGISLSFAFLIGVWAIVNNLDKLILSNLLPLADFAAFTIAVVAAGCVSLIASPVGLAVQTRLARLEAEGDLDGLIRLYRQTTQVLAATAFAVAMVLAFHAEGVLWAWTGNRALAVQAAPVLTLYAVGNGVVAIITATYFLQYAKGDLRLHLIGNLAMVAVLIPAIVGATKRWGAVGAGWAWLSCNATYLVLWVPVIHRRFVPGLHLRWLAIDVAPLAFVTAIVAGGTAAVLPIAGGRVAEGLLIASVSLPTLVCGVAASPLLRQHILRWLKARVAAGTGQS